MRVLLTICRNLGWLALGSVVLFLLCFHAPLPPVAATSLGPIVVLVYSWKHPIVKKEGERISFWNYVLAVFGVAYYAFVIWLVCAVIRSPRGLC